MILQVSDVFDRVASGYHGLWLPVIEPTSVRLLDLIEPLVEARPDALIVDVGAGTGALGRAAVARWPDVRVVGVDPSEGMLSVGRKAAAESLDPAALARLSWMNGAAERLPIASGTADAIVSSFSWQFVPARTRAYREARRVLRPGGALAVVTWLANDRPFVPWRELSEVLDELAIERPSWPRTAGAFASTSSAAAGARRAGFRDVEAHEATVEYQWGHEALVRCTLEEEEAETLEHVDAATRTQVEQRWRERLARLDDADLCYRDSVAYLTGRAPVASDPRSAC